MAVFPRSCKLRRTKKEGSDAEQGAKRKDGKGMSTVFDEFDADDAPRGTAALRTGRRREGAAVGRAGRPAAPNSKFGANTYIL